MVIAKIKQGILPVLNKVNKTEKNKVLTVS